MPIMTFKFLVVFLLMVTKNKFWNDETEKIMGLNNNVLNICFEAIDRNLDGPLKDSVAIRYIDPSWPNNPNAIKDITYQQFASETNKFAHALKDLGIKKGDVVFTLSPRIPELYTVALGSLRIGAIFSPLFSAFGPEPILARMEQGKAKVLFSYASLFRKKVLPILGSLPTLEHIILIDDDGSLDEIKLALNYYDLMRTADISPILEKTGPEDLALLHFTSGTTGQPKGALHVHQAVVYHKYSGQFALDFRPNDIFWCTADPGWVTGTSYGIISPLCNGVTILIDGAEFNASRWYEILKKFKVNVWYTAPTALRMLMRAGTEAIQNEDFSHVRFASSVGEPLNPEVIAWAKNKLHLSLHDNWWQTETGGIIICNDSNLPLRPGSMGRPVPGIEVALIKSYDGSQIQFVGEDDDYGEIAIRKGWPSMFRGYLNKPERYSNCFVGDWYLSGDLAKRDKDGYYWFVGRKDDVIKSSGHLIGPFEVESTLMEHPSVLESAVIGIPDTVAGEVIKAFVVLKTGFIPTEEQSLEIIGFSRRKLGVAIAPREIQFVDNLPKTRSGKIMRRLLKARELGLAEGDLSTLEEN